MDNFLPRIRLRVVTWVAKKDYSLDLTHSQFSLDQGHFQYDPNINGWIVLKLKFQYRQLFLAVLGDKNRICTLFDFLQSFGFEGALAGRFESC